jgi:FSR family fosmidomycin resistance protein-like MFS transporter
MDLRRVRAARGASEGPREGEGTMISAKRSDRLSQLFAWIGHATMHCLTGLFLTAVLALEADWHRPYGDLIALWTVGAFLVGALAPFAGWLGDRWSNAKMMTVFFLGSGLATIAAACASTPAQLGAALTALGAFAAIYHPVGLSWLVRTATNKGVALGIWGVFGSTGVAIAGVVAGGLTTLSGWRAALLIPGVVALVIGVLLLACVVAGWVVDGTRDRAPTAEPARGDVIRAFVVLSITVFLGGLIYNATQIALPKAFAERAEFLGGGVLGAGTLFTAIYLIASLLQIPAGWLSDRYPPRLFYLAAFVVQAPFMALAAAATGLPFVFAAAAMVMANVAAIPAENVLMVRYTPLRWRGSMFGAKFVLSLGVAPFAVQLVAILHERTGDFVALFTTLALCSAGIVVAAFLLPRERRVSTPVVVPAE